MIPRHVQMTIRCPRPKFAACHRSTGSRKWTRARGRVSPRGQIAPSARFCAETPHRRCCSTCSQTRGWKLRTCLHGQIHIRQRRPPTAHLQGPSMGLQRRDPHRDRTQSQGPRRRSRSAFSSTCRRVRCERWHALAPCARTFAAPPFGYTTRGPRGGREITSWVSGRPAWVPVTLFTGATYLIFALLRIVARSHPQCGNAILGTYENC